MECNFEFILTLRTHKNYDLNRQWTSGCSKARNTVMEMCITQYGIAQWLFGPIAWSKRLAHHIQTIHQPLTPNPLVTLEG
jgi:hypothetical protein